MMMVYSKRGLDLTEKFEGFRPQAYLDSVGVPTIGYGHTLGVKMGDSCYRLQAESWLLSDAQKVVDSINNDYTGPELTQNEFDALVDFGFNLGVHALEGSTLWRKLMAGDIAGAAAEFPKWDRAGGQEVAGLLRRRQSEQSLFMEADDK